MENVKFSAIDNLDYNIDFNHKFKHIYLFTYQIISDNCPNPFLKILLHKNNINKTLNFPLLNVNNNNQDIDTLIKYCKVFLLQTLGVTVKTEYLDEIKYKGNLIDTKLDISSFDTFNLFLYFDLTTLKFEKEDWKSFVDLNWLATVDEVLNKKYICQLPIHDFTVNFFERNIHFIHLTDNDNNPLYLPKIFYCGKSIEDLNYTFTFGQSRDDSDSFLKNNYVFTNYKNALIQGIWSENNKTQFKYGKIITDDEHGRFKQGGIVRFAIFNKKMQLIEDQKSIENLNYEDYLNSNVDSIYISNFDNESSLKLIPDINLPICIIKDKVNQIPLSYHLIDKNSLADYNNNQQIDFNNISLS
jgi:hypothetical protein